MFNPGENFKIYRNLPKQSPSIPFIAVVLKDLVFAYEANPTNTDSGAIYFEKMRIIGQIILSLKSTDYSFLKFDPQFAQSFINVSSFIFIFC